MLQCGGAGTGKGCQYVFLRVMCLQNCMAAHFMKQCRKVGYSGCCCFRVSGEPSEVE